MGLRDYQNHGNGQLGSQKDDFVSGKADSLEAVANEKRIKQREVFKDANKPKSKLKSNFVEDKIKNSTKKLSIDDVDKNKLQILSHKLLKPGTELINNFVDAPVINPLIDYVDNDEELELNRRDFNWEIYGDFRHTGKTILSDGVRLTLSTPEYLVTALNTLSDSINNAEDNATVRQLIKDLDVTNKKGELVTPGKKMKPMEYKIYSKSIKSTVSWLITSLLLGTIKIDSKLREKFISAISKQYKGREKEVRYMLENDIISPQVFNVSSNHPKLILSNELVKWYNYSLLGTAKRIFNSDYNEDSLIRSLDNGNHNSRRLNDGAVSNMLSRLGSDRMLISNRLHYILFVEK